MSGIGNIGEIQIIDFLKKEVGYAIYLPLKDVGIDFIGVKSNKFFQFQIKTSTFQKNSYFWFDIHKHKMVYGRNIFYVFICYTMSRHNMMGKSRNFLVIPSLDLKKWINNNQIPLKKGSDTILNIFVYPDVENQKWIFKNKGQEIDWTKYWNNFKQLK
jgi:hypothetical protein